MTNNELALRSVVAGLAADFAPDFPEVTITKKALKESWGDISAQRVDHVTGELSKAIASYPDPTYDGVVTDADLQAILDEAEALQEAEALIAARKELLKARIYATVDESNLTDPKVIEGVLPVSATKGEVSGESTNGSKVSLKRGGGGLSDATIDFEALKSELGEEKFNEVATRKIHHKREVIAAYDEFVVSEDTLEESLRDGKVSIEDLRKAIVPGKPKPSRFTITVKH